MSRYIHLFDEGSVAFGLDHTCGYFLQLFNYKGDIIVDIESHPKPYSGAVRMDRVHIAEYLTALGVPCEMTDRIILDLEI